jgi:hypothetical protein
MKDDLFILEENRKEDISREQQVWKKNRCYVSDYFLCCLSVFFLVMTSIMLADVLLLIAKAQSKKNLQPTNIVATVTSPSCQLS